MLSVLALLCLGVPAPAAQDTKRDFPDLALTLTLPPAFTQLKELPGNNSQMRQRWSAKVGSVDLDITFWAYPMGDGMEQFDFREPEDVMDVLLYDLRDAKDGNPNFSFETQRLVPGPFGICSYASLASGALRDPDGTQVIGTRFLLGGVVEHFGYSVEAVATPQPAPDAWKTIVAFFESSLAYKGPKRDPNWTDAEVKQRWEKNVPEKVQKELKQVVRTAHYLILTNSTSSGAGEKFGEQMERNYEAIRKVFPFDEIAGRKLMPVFLFLNEEDYDEFIAKQFNFSVEEANKSKGIAHEDWYATYFEAKIDPVHIHEGTHQIFKNRLRLGGGGSWFQEGVAVFMEKSKNDLNVAANTVKKNRQISLVDFVKIRSLLFSPKEDKKGADEAASHYDLAGLLIEFLHESKFGKDKFQEFVHTVGLAAPNSVQAIERAVKSVYGTDLAGLEKQWIEYCKTRR